MASFKQPTIKDFFQLNAEYVAYQPDKSKVCDRIFTWAVLNRYGDINNETLGKTIDEAGKCYFFSKKWATKNFNPSKLDWQYPAMFALQNSAEIHAPFDKKKKKDCYKLEMNFNDIVREDCIGKNKKKSECGDCAKRNRQEIWEDLYKQIKKWLSYICDVICVRNDEGEEFWVNRQVWIAKGSIGQELTGSGQAWSNIMRKSNLFSDNNRETKLDILKHEGGYQGAIGLFFDITLCFKYCELTDEDYKPVIKDYKKGFDSGCC